MKRHAPATARNSVAIGDVLEKELPKTGTVLEVASGSGEHAVFLARRFPHLQWQPSDMDTEALASVAAWREEERAPNLLAPIQIDASAADWPTVIVNAILCVNMIHISPWAATEGLFAHAASILGEGAPLICYGPYLERDGETAASNVAFDQSLKDRDPRWGLRLLNDVDALAARYGFTRAARYEMPANNLTLVWRRN